jgi:CBS domain-containing protein
MEAGDFQYLPVVDETGRLVGLVSERDLLRARAATPPPRLVSEVLTRQVPSIEPDAQAADAVQMMLDFEIDAVPVVANDKVIGILTVTDFLPEMRQLLRDTA